MVPELVLVRKTAACHDGDRSDLLQLDIVGDLPEGIETAGTVEVLRVDDDDIIALVGHILAGLSIEDPFHNSPQVPYYGYNADMEVLS